MKRILFVVCLLLSEFVHADQDEKIPGTVVFIHGFLRTQRSMSGIASSFKNEGIDTYRFWYKSREDTIEGHADKLNKELKTICEKKPGQPIHFVTHSLGGIILRAAVNRSGCPEEAKIGRVVMLAPPNRGSRLAKKISELPFSGTVLGDKAGKQVLKLTKKFVESFGTFPKEMKIMVIAGRQGLNPILEGPSDGKVLVSETILNQKHTHKCVDANHTFIMDHPKTKELAINFILK